METGDLRKHGGTCGYVSVGGQRHFVSIDSLMIDVNENT